MNCDELAHRLADGTPLSDDARAHAKRCPPCGSLVVVDRELGAMPSDIAIEPCAALREALANDCAPRRATSRWTRVAVPALAAAALAGVVWLVRPRHDFATAATPFFWFAAFAWIAIVAGGMRLLVARGRLGLGVPAAYRWLYIGFAVLAFEVLSVLGNRGDANSIEHVGSHTWWAHWTCAPSGSLAALALALPIFGLLRRSAVVAPEAAGALAGLVAGIGSVLASQMACGFADAMHYTTIHLVPIVMAIVMGAWVGRRTLAP